LGDCWLRGRVQFNQRPSAVLGRERVSEVGGRSAQHGSTAICLILVFFDEDGLGVFAHCWFRIAEIAEGAILWLLLYG
jgi:hypothetical protein